MHAEEGHVAKMLDWMEQLAVLQGKRLHGDDDLPPVDTEAAEQALVDMIDAGVQEQRAYEKEMRSQAGTRTLWVVGGVPVASGIPRGESRPGSRSRVHTLCPCLA